MANSLNRIVEEVVYQQLQKVVTDLDLVAQKIIETAKVAQQHQIKLSIPATSNADMNGKLNASLSIQKQMKTVIDTLEKGFDKLATTTTRYGNAVNKLTLEQRQRVIEDRIVRKGLDEEAISLSNNTTYIQKLTVERAKAIRTMMDYNASVEMGNEVTESQRLEYEKTKASFDKLDKAIKAGKNSVGDFKEDVGNYAKGASNLQYSISQISRELPNFGQSFAVGVLSLTNNVGQLQDALKQVRAQNAQLESEGKQTTSVLSQIKSAVFSWNTALFIAIGIFSAYSKEIGDWVESLWKGSEALQAVKKAQDEFKNSKIEATKSTIKDKTELKEWISVVQNQKATLETRKVDLDKIVSKYPAYFKNLKEEQLNIKDGTKLNEMLTKSLNNVSIAMDKRALADQIDEKVIKNKQRIADLESQISKKMSEEIAKAQDFDKAYEEAGRKQRSVAELTKEIKDNFLKKSDWVITGDDQKFKDALVEIKGLTEANTKALNGNGNALNSINQLRADSELLDFRPETDSTNENTKSIKLNTKAREDYLASEYELLHLKLSNAKDINKDIMDDESMNYEIRGLATEQYYNNFISLADMEYKEEMRLLALNYNNTIATKKAEYENEKNTLNDQLNDEKQSVSNKEIIRKQLAQNTADLDYDLANLKKQLGFNEQIASENLNKKLYDSAKELKDKLFDLWNNEIKIKIELGIATEELEDTKRLGELLKSIDFDNLAPTQANINTIKDKLKKIADLKTFYNRKSLADKLETDEQDLIMQMENFSKTEHDSKLYIDLEKKLTENRKQQADLRNEIASDEIQKKEDNLEKEKAIIDKQTELSKEFYFSLKDLANQLFDNTVNSYDKQIEKSNEYYDTLLANAEKGSEQERVLLEEKERREKELEKRKIDALRRQALFNKILTIAEIGIKTALNIVEAYPNPVTMALAGAIGAVQIATVAATPLPQYKDGTAFHPGGKALVGEVQTEVVENPDGSIFLTPNKPTILDLQKGAKVHSSLEDFNKSKFNLENASIMASFVNQSNQLKAFDYYVAKELNGLSGKIEKGIEKGFKKAKINNNNVNNVYIGRKPSNFFN